MSTRSRIGIERVDGTVVSIYCHFDGYPEGVGAILAEHYTNRNKIETLLSLGDLSSLGPEIGEKHPFHCGDENVCTFYARDRGEPIGEVIAQTHTIDSFKKEDFGVAYLYLFRLDNIWRYSAAYARPKRFLKLKPKKKL